MKLRALNGDGQQIVENEIPRGQGSCFTTIRVKHDRIWWWREHCQRLEQSLSFLGLRDSLEDFFQVALKELKELVRSLPASKTWSVRFHCYWNGQELTYGFIPRDCAISVPRVLQSKKLSSLRNEYPPFLKTDSLLIYPPGEEPPYLLMDQGEQVQEGSFFNIIFGNEYGWVTPRSSGKLLNGLCRQWLLKRKVLNSLPLVEKEIFYQDLADYRHCYAINAARGLWQVHEIDDMKYTSDSKIELKMNEDFINESNQF